jgi:hypothetical protein
LLRYGYSGFRLDILEYCYTTIIIEREQYYLNNLKLEYNILKFAISLYGFKHCEATKLKLSANSLAYPVTAINNKTGEVKLFTSIIQAAKFIGIHNSYITRCLKNNKFYIGRGYYITKNLDVNNDN